MHAAALLRNAEFFNYWKVAAKSNRKLKCYRRNQVDPTEKIWTELAGQKIAAAIRAPLVTIVIVNYNYGEFLERCIRSVDEQDYLNIQCIILDSGSSDNSLSVIDEALAHAKNPFFQVLRRDFNHGHLINSLSALDDAKGTFIAYLDADDLLFPEFVSTHVKAHLNELNSAAISASDQIQVDAADRILAGTCHWHQKWRAFEQETAWTELTHARNWTRNSPSRARQEDTAGLYYIPAWWSSWLMERWIWSATSGLMFRKSVIESIEPPKEQYVDLHHIGLDAYFARFAHSVGGTLVVDSALGAYRRHGQNIFSGNPVLGGQTPSGTGDEVERFQIAQRVARQTLVAKNRDLKRLFGKELYYSIAWQLMSNDEFLTFAQGHEGDRIFWEKCARGG
jgi:glycosyltransferase involved in cell wall biosynthesis